MQKKTNPIATQHTQHSLVASQGLYEIQNMEASGAKLDQMIKKATAEINEYSQVLKSTLLNIKENESHFGTGTQVIPVANQMLIKFVLSWNEAAYAYRANGMHSEAMQAYQTAIFYYNKLNMRNHQAFASADFYLTQLILTKDLFVGWSQITD